jgi:hypothetical protein
MITLINYFRIDGGIDGFQFKVSPDKVNKLLRITSKAFASEEPQAAAAVEAIEEQGQELFAGGEAVIPDEITIKYVLYNQNHNLF